MVMVLVSLACAPISWVDDALPASPVQWFVTLFAVPLIASAVGWTTWSKERSRRVTSA